MLREAFDYVIDQKRYRELCSGIHQEGPQSQDHVMQLELERDRDDRQSNRRDDCWE